MRASEGDFDGFLALSAVLTDFSTFRLNGTGVATLYFDTVVSVVGAETTGQLIQAFRGVEREAGDSAQKLDEGLRSEIFSDDKLGPVARNIIKLWFIGTWYQLPQQWRSRFGTNVRDRTFIPAPQAYVEGLLWPAIGAHPPGAKAPGYGTWSEAPAIPKNRLPTL